MSTEKLMSTEAPKTGVMSTEAPKLPISVSSPSSPVSSATSIQSQKIGNITTATTYNPVIPTVKTPQLTTKQISELDTASARIASGTASATDIANVEYAKKNKGYTYTPAVQTPIAPTPTPPTGTQGVTDPSQINSLYQKYFKRDATSAEIANWSKEPSSSLDSFLQSEQKKYGVTPTTETTTPKITSEIPEPTKIDLTDYKVAQEATQKAIDEAKTAREAYLKASSETGVLTAEDKASIEEAGKKAAEAYDVKIRAAQEEKRQQMARDLIGAGQAGGLMSTQFAGVGAFAQTFGGTFVGAGGLLGRLEDQYSTAIAELQSAQEQAKFNAEQAKEQAIKTGKKEDLDRMYQAYQVMNDVVEQQNTLAQQKFDEAQALYDVQRYEKEDATATIKSLADAGYTADDVPESYATAIERSANMPTGYVKQYLKLSEDTKKAQSIKDANENANTLIDLFNKTGTTGKISINGVDYTYEGYDEAGMQKGQEVDDNGLLTSWTVDKYGNKTVTPVGYIGKTQGGTIEKADDGTLWNVSKDGKTMTRVTVGTSQSSFASIFPPDTDAPALEDSTAQGQCGAFCNYLYGEHVIPDSYTDKVTTLESYGGKKPTSLDEISTYDTFVQKIGDERYGHVGIVLDKGTDTKGNDYIIAGEANIKGDGKVTATRQVYLKDIAISATIPTRLPASGSNAEPTFGKKTTGDEASIYAKGLISGDVKLTNVPQEVRAQAIQQAMAGGWGGESDGGTEMTPQQYSRFMSITTKYQADTAINSALGADNYISIADRVIADPGNAASQISMLYTFVKALDPNSAVREGEISLANSTQSVLSKLQTNVEKINSGKAISSDAAKSIAEETKILVEGWKKLADKKTNMYRSQAVGAGVGDSFDAYTGRFDESNTETHEVGETQSVDNILYRWDGSVWQEIGSSLK